MKATSGSSHNTASTATSASSILNAASSINKAPAATVIASSSSAVVSSSSRERRIVGGGQQHPQAQHQQFQQHQQHHHHRSYSSAYRQYYNSKLNSSSSSRQQRAASSSSSNYAWLRNPFVVFFMSFVALGSLRLRVRHFHSNNNNSNIHHNSNQEHSTLKTVVTHNSVSQKLRNSIPQAVNRFNNKVTRAAASAAMETNIPPPHSNNQNQKTKNNNSIVVNMPPLPTTTSQTTKLPPPPVAMEYVLAEEGKLFNKRSFQRFSVHEKGTKRPISIKEWTEALSSLPQENSSYMADFVNILKNAPYTAYFWETKGVTDATQQAATQAFEFVLVDAPELHRFATATARNAAEKAALVTLTGGQKSSSFSSSTAAITVLTAHVPFADQFSSKQCDSSSSGNDLGCIFENLSGDATLIAPKPLFVLPLLVNPNDRASSTTGAAAATAEISEIRTSSSSPLDYYANQFATYTHLAAFCRGASPGQVESVLQMAISAYAQRLLDAKSSSASTPVWFSTSGLGVAWLHFRLDARPKYYTYSPFAQEQ